MQNPSQRIVTAVAGALGALVLAFPMRSSADWYGYRDNDQWGTARPYAQRYYGGDDCVRNRPNRGRKCRSTVTQCSPLCCCQGGQKETSAGYIQEASLSERYDLIPV
jgi:hypothetical protein